LIPRENSEALRISGGIPRRLRAIERSLPDSEGAAQTPTHPVDVKEARRPRAGGSLAARNAVLRDRPVHETELRLDRAVES
jgi:hypothetical protein